jgi:hypothetical protein
MYRGSTIEGPVERVEPRRLWESGPKATCHERCRCHWPEAAMLPWTRVGIFIEPLCNDYLM